MLNAIQLLHQVQAAAEPSLDTNQRDPRRLSPQNIADALNVFAGAPLLRKNGTTWRLGTNGGSARVVSGGGKKTGVAVFTSVERTAFTGYRGVLNTGPYRVQLHDRAVTVLTKLSATPHQVLATKSSQGLDSQVVALFVLKTIRAYIEQLVLDHERNS